MLEDQKDARLTHFRPMFHLWINQLLVFTSKMSLILRCFFKYFASKNQLPGFYIIETLAGNGLNSC